MGGHDHKGLSHVAEVQIGGDWERDETIQQFKFPKLAKVSKFTGFKIIVYHPRIPSGNTYY